MHFEIGEKVIFLNDTGSGIIREFKDSNTVIIEDETGFDRPVPVNELVKIQGDQSRSINANVVEFLSEEELAEIQHKSSGDHLKRFPDFWEIDLHTHNILETEAGMSSGALLNYQLLAFKEAFEEARQKRVPRLVVIHGIGKGVLKSEIRTFLSHKDGIEFYDASFAEYGKGATEVRIFQNYSNKY